jgi:hypothetical protein
MVPFHLCCKEHLQSNLPCLDPLAKNKSVWHTFTYHLEQIVWCFDSIRRTNGCLWPKATVKSPVGARDLRPVWSFISFIFSYLLFFIWPLPCPLPCPTPLPCKIDRTAGAWVGHVIRCVILKMRSVGLLPLGDESLVNKRSWEANCMFAALKKRDFLFGERFSPFILIHRQNRFCHRKCRGWFCRWIKMQNCSVGQTHGQTNGQTSEFIYKIGTFPWPCWNAIWISCPQTVSYYVCQFKRPGQMYLTSCITMLWV